jgi:hypothetical protein
MTVLPKRTAGVGIVEACSCIEHDNITTLSHPGCQRFDIDKHVFHGQFLQSNGSPPRINRTTPR